MARAALFDLDRTLVRRDTASLYVKYQRDRGEATLRQSARVAYWLLQYTLGVIDAPRVAERALSSLVGKEEEPFRLACEEWFRDYVKPHLCDEGRRTVERHRASGELVAIVTGAATYTAWPAARELGIEHVACTELEVVDGRFTGRAVQPIGYGEGKITLATRLAERTGFTLADATFYTDSATDLPLLEKVARPIAVNPDLRLRRIARRRGWPVEKW